MSAFCFETTTKWKQIDQRCQNGLNHLQNDPKTATKWPQNGRKMAEMAVNLHGQQNGCKVQRN